MDILLNNILPSNSNNTQWVYKEEDVFKKFTQYYDVVVKPEDKTNTNVICEINTKVEDKKETDDIIEKTEKTNKKVIDKPPDTKNIDKKNKSKDTKKKPYDVILEYSQCPDVDFVKNKFIEFISHKEFGKVFGIKKTAEIMKGLTENKWNKSLVIFISFLFDMKIIYLSKEVCYSNDYEYSITLVV